MALKTFANKPPTALRRFGSYRQDLNAELLKPFTLSIAGAWSRVFENDLFDSFEALLTQAIDRLIDEVDRSAHSGLKDHAHHQGTLCINEAKSALRRAANDVRVSMQAERKKKSLGV